MSVAAKSRAQLFKQLTALRAEHVNMLALTGYRKDVLAGQPSDLRTGQPNNHCGRQSQRSVGSWSRVV